MKTFVVGISGRSGSGKSTIVKEILNLLGPDKVVLHSMDDYYLPRDEQIVDESGYINFDLPSSFLKDQFHQNLIKLRSAQTIKIVEYVFNSESEAKIKHLTPAPIILVAGLFINHFDDINKLLDLSVFIHLSENLSFERRLRRDQICRNYKEEEITHRFHKHAEPAFKKYIKPYEPKADFIIHNDGPIEENISFQELIALFKEHL